MPSTTGSLEGGPRIADDAPVVAARSNSARSESPTPHDGAAPSLTKQKLSGRFFSARLQADPLGPGHATGTIPLRRGSSCTELGLMGALADSINISGTFTDGTTGGLPSELLASESFEVGLTPDTSGAFVLHPDGMVRRESQVSASSMEAIATHTATPVSLQDEAVCGLLGLGQHSSSSGTPSTAHTRLSISSLLMKENTLPGERLESEGEEEEDDEENVENVVMAAQNENDNGGNEGSGEELMGKDGDGRMYHKTTQPPSVVTHAIRSAGEGNSGASRDDVAAQPLIHVDMAEMDEETVSQKTATRASLEEGSNHRESTVCGVEAIAPSELPLPNPASIIVSLTERRLAEVVEPPFKPPLQLGPFDVADNSGVSAHRVDTPSALARCLVHVAADMCLPPLGIINHIIPLRSGDSSLTGSRRPSDVNMQTSHSRTSSRSDTGPDPKAVERLAKASSDAYAQLRDRWPATLSTPFDIAVAKRAADAVLFPSTTVPAIRCLFNTRIPEAVISGAKAYGFDEVTMTLLTEAVRYKIAVHRLPTLATTGRIGSSATNKVPSQAAEGRASKHGANINGPAKKEDDDETLELLVVEIFAALQTALDRGNRGYCTPCEFTSCGGGGGSSSSSVVYRQTAHSHGDASIDKSINHQFIPSSAPGKVTQGSPTDDDHIPPAFRPSASIPQAEAGVAYARLVLPFLERRFHKLLGSSVRVQHAKAAFDALLSRHVANDGNTLQGPPPPPPNMRERNSKGEAGPAVRVRSSIPVQNTTAVHASYTGIPLLRRTSTDGGAARLRIHADPSVATHQQPQPQLHQQLPSRATFGMSINPDGNNDSYADTTNQGTGKLQKRTHQPYAVPVLDVSDQLGLQHPPPHMGADLRGIDQGGVLQSPIDHYLPPSAVNVQAKRRSRLQPHDAPLLTRTIYVSPFPVRVRDHELRGYFSQFGMLLKVRESPLQRNMKAFFVEFVGSDAADAMLSHDRTTVFGCQIRVHRARTPVFDTRPDDGIVDEHGRLVQRCQFGSLGPGAGYQ